MSDHAVIAAKVATGVSWAGAVTSVAAQALPVLQCLAAIAAIVGTIITVRIARRRK